MTRLWLAGAFLAIAVVASCFQSASGLAPFPCAADLTCPGGLGCVDGSCQPAVFDATCSTGNDPTTCATAAASAICSATLAVPMSSGNAMVGSGSPIVPPVGACETPCPCTGGRVCTNGVCLADCTSSASACPPNTKCLGSTGTSTKACVPNGLACQSVVGTARCTSQLCTQRTNEVGCPDMQHNCPQDSVCNATSTSCTCNVGRLAFVCADDTPCNGCSGGTYWCAPDVTTFTCFSDLDGAMATCRCWDGTTRTVDCNVTGKSCEDLCANR